MAQTTVPSKAIISSVGSVTGGGSVSVPRPVITGTADAGTTVNVYDGVRLLGTAIVNSSGAWTFTPTADLKSGAHQFAAIAIDSTGHAGTASDAVAVKIQSNAPASTTR
jgi:large repetitive protein